ncbi:hypothetical protein EVAR_79498_1 [Eumeta japonica]|uniref:Uncharacterized protein n=1 Tax=Eumeta variegata TaxID=151549 RepID=A0A4C1UE28_EUMVA|nr:hypothetical protein EVAR_79498_1 [Eumeta japonica]
MLYGQELSFCRSAVLEEGSAGFGSFNLDQIKSLVAAYPRREWAREKRDLQAAAARRTPFDKQTSARGCPQIKQGLGLTLNTPLTYAPPALAPAINFIYIICQRDLCRPHLFLGFRASNARTPVSMALVFVFMCSKKWYAIATGDTVTKCLKTGNESSIATRNENEGRTESRFECGTAFGT